MDLRISTSGSLGFKLGSSCSLAQILLIFNTNFVSNMTKITKSFNVLLADIVAWNHTPDFFRFPKECNKWAWCRVCEASICVEHKIKNEFYTINCLHQL